MNINQCTEIHDVLGIVQNLVIKTAQHRKTEYAEQHNVSLMVYSKKITYESFNIATLPQKGNTTMWLRELTLKAYRQGPFTDNREKAIFDRVQRATAIGELTLSPNAPTWEQNLDKQIAEAVSTLVESSKEPILQRKLQLPMDNPPPIVDVHSCGRAANIGILKCYRWT